MAELKAI